MGLPSKVTLHFGPLTTVVKLLTAVDDEGTGLKMVCVGDENKAHDPASVKMPAVCTDCARAGNIYQFPRAREVDGKLVVVTPEELAETKGAPVKEIVVQSHPVDQVLAQTFPGGSQYLLVPSDAISVEVYSVIRQTLIDNPECALVVKDFAVTSSNKSWRVGVFEGGLSLSELARPDSVRARPAIARVDPDKALREAANKWMTTFTTPFVAMDYRDTAKESREALIAAKLGTAPDVIASTSAGIPNNVSMSLLEKLAASVEEAKPKKQARKTAAKKTVAKKATKVSA